MGILEGDSGIRIDLIKHIAPDLVQPGDMEILESFVDLAGRNSLDKSLLQALLALHYPTSITEAPRGYAIVLETAKRTRQVIENIPESDLSFSQEHMFEWGEGAFTLTMAKQSSDARLFEIGFLFDDYGSLAIFKIQKHRLGSPLRKIINSVFPDLHNEKVRADTILMNIRKDLSPDQPDSPSEHLYGLLSTIALLGPHSSGMIIFPEANSHPEIVWRRDHLIQLKQEYQQKRLKGIKKEIKGIRWEINKLFPLVDFRQQLQALGVRNITGPDHDFISAPYEEIIQSAHIYLTDPAYPTRFPYWKTLEEILDMQEKRTRP
jgi:hypothetical protein